MLEDTLRLPALFDFSSVLAKFARFAQELDEPHFSVGEAMGEVGLQADPPMTEGEEDHGRIVPGYLRNLEPGPVEQTKQLERRSSNVWHDLGGDVAAMTGQKLSVEWSRLSGIDLRRPS